MFPRIPHDPVTFYLVPDPIPPPIDTERLLSHIDWQVSLDKFHRDRAAIQERLGAKADEAKAKKKEREEREAKGDFGPMDERYFPKLRVRKRESRWECLKEGLSRKPSENYGGGTVVRSVNEAKGNTGQLIRKNKPRTLIPWPRPWEVAISKKRLKLYAALSPLVVKEVKRNMAKAEAERKSQIPPPHLTGVARAYWLIQAKMKRTRPYFVNPLYDKKSALTGKAPDGRVYDSSDYEPCD